MRYNEDRLLSISSELETWDAEHPHWFPISRFARFSILSGLAPQIVEEPFLGIWKRKLLRTTSKKLELVPRKHTKSSFAKAFDACLLCEVRHHQWGPQVRIGFGGETTDFAERTVRAVRQILVTNEWIVHEYGNLKPNRDLIEEWSGWLKESGLDPDLIAVPEWTTNMFRTALCVRSEIETGNRLEEPSMMAFGFDRATTGRHYDVFTVDDAMTRKSAKSVVRKQTAKDCYHEYQSQVMGTGFQDWEGTRHAEDDLYAYIMEEYHDQFEIEQHDCWDGGKELARDDFELVNGVYVCRLPLKDVSVLWDGFEGLEEDIRRHNEGLPPFTPEERKKRTLHYLAKEMFSMPPQQFANQYLNRPTALEDQLWFDDMFITYNAEDVGVQLRHYVLTDSATGKDYRSSYRVVAVVSLDWRGNAFVRSLDFGRWNPEEYCSRILDAASAWNAQSVLMERVSWQESFKTVMELITRASGKKMPRVQDVEGRSELTKLSRIESSLPRFLAAKARADGKYTGMPFIAFDPNIKNQECEGRNSWREMLSQYKRVHELDQVKGLLLDIPDALSDLDAQRPKTGERYCKPPKRLAEAPSFTREEAVQRAAMAPYRARVAEQTGKASGAPSWTRGRKPGLWE